MSRKKRKKYRGHFCWCCGRIRPNEEFSGKGHARHLCRECARFGREELEYQQALRNMERCLSGSGHILRKRRKQFESFLHHKNPRVLATAKEWLDTDARQREEWRRIREDEALAEEARFLEFELPCINLELAEAAKLDTTSGVVGFSV